MRSGALSSAKAPAPPAALNGSAKAARSMVRKALKDRVMDGSPGRAEAGRDPPYHASASRVMQQSSAQPKRATTARCSRNKARPDRKSFLVLFFKKELLSSNRTLSRNCHATRRTSLDIPPPGFVEQREGPCPRVRTGSTLCCWPPRPCCTVITLRRRARPLRAGCSMRQAAAIPRSPPGAGATSRPVSCRPFLVRAIVTDATSCPAATLDRFHAPDPQAALHCQQPDQHARHARCYQRQDRLSAVFCQPGGDDAGQFCQRRTDGDDKLGRVRSRGAAWTHGSHGRWRQPAPADAEPAPHPGHGRHRLPP